MKRVVSAMLLALCVVSTSIFAADEAKSAEKAAMAAAPVEEKAEAAESKAEEDDSVTISADRMEMEMGNKATLEGNVLLEDNKMILSGDRVTIFFEEEGGEGEDEDGDDEDSLVRGTGQVSRIEATGSVMIRTPDGGRSATGERGYYDRRKDTFILEGNCTILADGHALKSNKVIFDHQKQTFSAERAALTFNLKKGGKNDGGDILGGVFGVGDEKDKAKEEAKSSEARQQNASPAAEPKAAGKPEAK